MEPNEMKRYDIGYDEDGYEMGLESDGEWVRYSDAMQIITALQSQIDGMIKRPVVEVVQMNNGDDRMFEVTVNSVLLFKSSEDDAEDIGDAFATRIRQALGMDDAKEGGEG